MVAVHDVQICSFSTVDNRMIYHSAIVMRGSMMLPNESSAAAPHIHSCLIVRLSSVCNGEGYIRLHQSCSPPSHHSPLPSNLELFHWGVCKEPAGLLQSLIAPILVHNNGFLYLRLIWRYHHGSSACLACCESDQGDRRLCVGISRDSLISGLFRQDSGQFGQCWVNLANPARFPR